MNDQALTIHLNVKYSEWLVWDNLAERVASGGHATKEAAEVALKSLQARRAK